MNKPDRLPRLDDFTAYRPSADMVEIDAEPNEDLTPKQRVFSWTCSLVAAAIMLETLFFKFTGAQESVYIFHKMGTEPWWRWGQGVWELTASICLLMPRWKWAGGIFTTGAMAAALISHMTWLGFSILGDHGLLFGMAVTTFTCGFTVLIIHRHSIPFVTPLSSW